LIFYGSDGIINLLIDFKGVNEITTLSYSHLIHFYLKVFVS